MTVQRHASALWRAATWRRRVALIAIAIALAFALTAWRVGGRNAGDQAGRPAPQPALQMPTASTSTADPSAPAGADRLFDPEAVVTRARQRLDRYPAVDWNVDARADALGADVGAALAYVRDEIGYEPYSGALRGPSGTYTARAGNAVDRALLLARLLGRHGVPTRFAIGTLPEEHSRQLLARTFARKPGVPLSALPVTDGDTLRERVFRRARRDYAAVRAALGTRLQPVTQPTGDQLLREMNPHVWVQAEVHGQWVDLDPSFADATVGRTIAALDRTAAELPPELFQRIAIRIVVDRLSNGALSTSTLLEVARNTVDITDKQVAVSHVPKAASSGLGAAMAGAFGRPVEPQWMPLLLIDGASTFGATLDLAALVTEWLEVELSWPDGRREITRRALVDRRRAAWPAAPPFETSSLDPLQRSDSGPIALLATHNVWFSSGPHNMSEFAVAMWEMAERAVSDHASDLERAADETTPRPPASESPGETLWPLALPNFAWMVWTDHVVIPLLNDRPGIRLYSDGPRIGLFTAGPQSDGRTMALADLRRDDLRGVVETAADASILADKKLWFGLLQGAFEHEAMSEYVALAGGDVGTVESTSSAVAGPIVLVEGPTSPASGTSSPEAAARLRSSLQDRHLVVSSAAGLPKGYWWEVARGTGDVRAVASLGLHGVSGRNLPRQQIKNSGKGGTFGTDEYIKKAREEQRALANAKKQREAIRQYQQSLTKPNSLTSPKSGSGGGEMGEYAAVLAVAVLHAIAYHILSQMLTERIEIEIEHVVDWLKAGGFRQALGG